MALLREVNELRARFAVSRLHPLDSPDVPSLPGVYMLICADEDAAEDIGLPREEWQWPLYVGRAYGARGLRKRIAQHRAGHANGYSPGLYLQEHLGEALGLLPRGWDLFNGTPLYSLPGPLGRLLLEGRREWMSDSLRVCWIEAPTAETAALEAVARQLMGPLLNPEVDLRYFSEQPEPGAPVLSAREMREDLAVAGLHDALTPAAFWARVVRDVALSMYHLIEELPAVGEQVTYEAPLTEDSSIEIVVRTDPDSSLEALVSETTSAANASALIDALSGLEETRRLAAARYEATRRALRERFQEAPTGRQSVEVVVPLASG